MNRLVCTSLVAMSAAGILSTGAKAQNVSGTVQVSLSGSLRGGGTGYTTVDCKATVYLIPTLSGTATLSTTSLLSLLNNGEQSTSAHAGFPLPGGNPTSTGGSYVIGTGPSSSNVGTVTNYVCIMVVPYNFRNWSTSSLGGASLAIMYEVSASDIGGYFPNPTGVKIYPGGHIRQIQTIAASPLSNPYYAVDYNVNM